MADPIEAAAEAAHTVHCVCKSIAPCWERQAGLNLARKEMERGVRAALLWADPEWLREWGPSLYRKVKEEQGG